MTSIIESKQLEHLDDTDCYALAWSDAVTAAANTTNNKWFVKWGGRGQGGRGRARRTVQKQDVIVDDLRLEYTGSSSSRNKLLLEHATLKLLHGHTYALIGPSGCGKSSLLRRIHAGKVPGFPLHLKTLYIPQQQQDESTTLITPIEFVQERQAQYVISSQSAGQVELEQLELAMEELDPATEEGALKMEELANCIAELEDEINENNNNNNSSSSSTDEKNEVIQDALSFMDVPEKYWNVPMSQLSQGILQKIKLAVIPAVLFTTNTQKTSIDILLLDEPTSGLDVHGLLQLRQLLLSLHNNNFTNMETHQQAESNSNNNSNNNRSTDTIILFVSHDVDFINSVTTDIIAWHDKLLYYTAGNYVDYTIVCQQYESQSIKLSTTLEKKKQAMKQTITNLKNKKPNKKNKKQIDSHKKRMEKELQHIESTTESIPLASTNSNNSNNNSNMPGGRKQRRGNNSDEPDKAIQFVFRKVKSQWHEPLIMAMDVGHGFDLPKKTTTTTTTTTPATAASAPGEADFLTMMMIPKKDGYLFDCVDLRIDEGGTYCILGENGCGKSVFLQLLAKRFPPVEGKILHALNVDVEYIDQQRIDESSSIMLQYDNQQQEQQQDTTTKTTTTTTTTTTVLEYLTEKYPLKTNQEIRGELTNFGLSTPSTTGVPLPFLSGGERRRLCLAECMLSSNPHVLILDDPTSNLDVQSVQALIYGLSQWNGTIIVASHDAHFVRTLDAQCFVLLPDEGKLRRVNGGIDAYLKSFGSTASPTTTTTTTM